MYPQPSGPSLRTGLKKEASSTAPQSESLDLRRLRWTQGFWLKGSPLPHSALPLECYQMKVKRQKWVINQKDNK